ncbi:MAG: hypothetical protein EBU49_05765 [Proteobacteria bacterium]|nr:hypothetical protein [Pseudomonadota bacterium]
MEQDNPFSADSKRIKRFDFIDGNVELAQAASRMAILAAVVGFFGGILITSLILSGIVDIDRSTIKAILAVFRSSHGHS